MKQHLTLADRFGRNSILKSRIETLRDLLAINGIPAAAVNAFIDGKQVSLDNPVTDQLIEFRMMRTYHLVDLLQPPILLGFDDLDPLYTRDRVIFRPDGSYERLQDKLSANLTTAIECDFIEANKEVPIVRPGESYLLGLSGGRDSISLLLLLNELRKSIPFELTAVHVTSTVPAKETDYSIDLCQSNGVPIIIKDEGFVRDIYNINYPIEKLLDFKRQIDGPFSTMPWLHLIMRTALESVGSELGVDAIFLGLMRDDLFASALRSISLGLPLLPVFRHNWGKNDFAYPLWALSKSDVYNYVKTKVPHQSNQSNATIFENGYATRDALYLVNDVIESALPGHSLDFLLGLNEQVLAQPPSVLFQQCRGCSTSLRILGREEGELCPICECIKDHGVAIEQLHLSARPTDELALS